MSIYLGKTNFGIAAVLCAIATGSLSAQDAEDSAPATNRGFGGPSSVGGQLDADREIREEKSPLRVFDRALEPWFDFKSRIEKDYGLTYGIDYTSLLMATSASLGDDRGFGGVARVFGNWDLIDPEGPEVGSLVFKVENRHRLGTDTAPQELGLSNGYLGLPGAAFTDYDWGVTNFFWRHRFGERGAIVAGLVNVSDYLDYYGMTNPFTQFQNFAFLSNPSIPFPGAGLGAAFGTSLGDNFYLTGGFADANGDPTTLPFDSFGEGEFFKHAEIGWASSYARRFKDNVHLSGWHVDENDQAEVAEGWGLAFSATRLFDDTWMPFLRAGYADGGASLLKKTVSAGLGKFDDASKNNWGVALHWGQPPDGVRGDQWAGELFYHVQVSENLAITPSIQLIGNPALNPEEDSLAYFGIRTRFAF